MKLNILPLSKDVDVNLTASDLDLFQPIHRQPKFVPLPLLKTYLLSKIVRELGAYSVSCHMTLDELRLLHIEACAVSADDLTAQNLEAMTAITIQLAATIHQLENL